MKRIKILAICIVIAFQASLGFSVQAEEDLTLALESNTYGDFAVGLSLGLGVSLGSAMITWVAPTQILNQAKVRYPHSTCVHALLIVSQSATILLPWLFFYLQQQMQNSVEDYALAWIQNSRSTSLRAGYTVGVTIPPVCLVLHHFIYLGTPRSFRRWYDDSLKDMRGFAQGPLKKYAALPWAQQSGEIKKDHKDLFKKSNEAYSIMAIRILIAITRCYIPQLIDNCDAEEFQPASFPSFCSDAFANNGCAYHYFATYPICTGNIVADSLGACDYGDDMEKQQVIYQKTARQSASTGCSLFAFHDLICLASMSPRNQARLAIIPLPSFDQLLLTQSVSLLQYVEIIVSLLRSRKALEAILNELSGLLEESKVDLRKYLFLEHYITYVPEFYNNPEACSLHLWHVDRVGRVFGPLHYLQNLGMLSEPQTAGSRNLLSLWLNFWMNLKILEQRMSCP
jgi:hypothetical protein